jgi:hypothetical protein
MEALDLLETSQTSGEIRKLLVSWAQARRESTGKLL